MFRKITAKALAVILAAIIAIGTFTVSAKASRANPYAGTWVSSVQGTGVTATMAVAENGTVCVVFSDQPNNGTFGAFRYLSLGCITRRKGIKKASCRDVMS